MIGLVALPGSENYSLIGSYGQPGVDSMHSSNHWVTPLLSQFILDVATQYKSAFPDAEVLKINDGSLQFGGLFDTHNDWRRPHASHRKGHDIDVDDLSPAKLLKLRSIVRKVSKGRAWFHNEGNHYHIRYSL